MRDEVRQRVFGTLLMNSLLRWESLVTIMVTAILFLFVNDISVLGVEWQPWFWLVLGGLVEGALVASTITDPNEAQEAMAREFESQYDLSHIRTENSRDQLRKALEYRRDMLKLSKRHQGSMRTNLSLSERKADRRTASEQRFKRTMSCWQCSQSFYP